jgi:acetoin utilization deacetylase AcuC-like enzyme
MRVFYSETHRLHNPPFEVFDGGVRVPYLENPDRMDRILSVLKGAEWADFEEPADFGVGPISKVHDAGYLDFLSTAWAEWLALTPETGSEGDPRAFLPATFALRSQSHRPHALLGRAGYHMMDLSAVIVAGTYQAALSAANCSLTGAQAIQQGARTALALCRPPGHHAGNDFAAGYCFINNAAVAANWLSGFGRVAILDIDYHAGNGTQEIFYERPDVLTISIHADPAFEYPYFSGYMDEIGLGAGTGYHRNFPLSAGTGDSEYLETLSEAMELIGKSAPSYLVLSVGLDIYEGDPLGKFKITRDGIRAIGARIAGLGLPTLYVLEGGYNNAALGENLGTFLVP